MGGQTDKQAARRGPRPLNDCCLSRPPTFSLSHPVIRFREIALPLHFPGLNPTSEERRRKASLSHPRHMCKIMARQIVSFYEGSKFPSSATFHAVILKAPCPRHSHGCESRYARARLVCVKPVFLRRGLLDPTTDSTVG